MASKHSIKQYLPNSYYHIYNRGVEKRKIFQDEQDFAVFLSYLKTYLEFKDINSLRQQLIDQQISWSKKRNILTSLALNNFYGEIQLLAYCLMSNHFHLLIRQKSATAIDSFMQSFSIRYAMYFNKKNKRVGPLFQGKYKAVSVTTDEQLLHLSRYIHLNPKKQCKRSDPLHCYYSSYKNYLGLANAEWVETKTILSYFSETNPQLTYSAFVGESKSGENELIASLIL